MELWLEQGNGLMFVGVIAGLGLLVRMVLFLGYGKLYRECKRFEMSRHKVIVYIKKDLKRRREEGQEIRNAMTYTECRLAECRVLGMRIGWLENMLLYSSLVVLLCGVMTAFAGALSGGEERNVLLLLFVSGVTVLGVLITDMVLGLHDKYRRIRLMIRDYIENNWSARTEGMEKNLLPAELLGKTVKPEEKQARVREKSRMSKDKPVKAKMRKKGKAQEEKRRLTEELLRERRQLEARSFAEQRRREQDVQAEVEQVQEEAAAAVTQCEETEGAEIIREEAKMICSDTEPEQKEEERSYERMMSEVLAEYLA